MAEFGVAATQLTGPQGSGAAVVRPVESMDIGPNPLYNVASSVADIFVKGIEVDRKEAADRRKQSILSEYTGKIKKFTDGLESGKLDPARVSVLSKSTYAEYMANYTEYAKEFTEIAKGMEGYSSISDAEQEVKDKRESKKRQQSAAEAAGYYIPPGASDEFIQTVIKTNAVRTQADIAFKDLAARRSEVRTEDTYKQGILKREGEELAFQTVNALVGSNLEHYQQLARVTGEAARSGKITQDQARYALTSAMGQIKAGLLAAARGNPGLAEPYGRLFDDVEKLGLKLSESSQFTQDLENEWKGLKTRALLASARHDPKVLAAIVTSEAFPLNPAIQLQVKDGAQTTFALISRTPLGKANELPVVVGGYDPKVEEGVLTLLKASVSDLVGGKFTKKDAAKVDISNTANHLLLQMGKYVDAGSISPERLLPYIDALSGPEMGKFSEMGGIDKASGQAAKKAVQVFFRPVAEQIMAKLGQSPLSPTGEPPFIPGTTTRSPITFAHMFDMTMENGSVTFKPKTGNMGSVAQVQAQQRAAGELKAAETLINKSLRAAAHLSQTTDYTKVWEESKHEMFPQLFSKPATPAKPASKEAPAGSERSISDAVNAPDLMASQGLTQDVLKSLKKDLADGKLTTAQKKELLKLLEGLKE